MKLPKGTGSPLSNRNSMVSSSNISLHDVISQIQHIKPQHQYSYSIGVCLGWRGETGILSHGNLSLEVGS